MSKSYGTRDLSESFQDFLTGAAKLLFSLGALASLISVGILVFTCFKVAGQETLARDAMNNVELFKKVLAFGVTGVAIGSTYLFWGEELLGAAQLLIAGALYFAPLYVPMLMGSDKSPNEAINSALSAIQLGGLILGLIAIVVLVVDIANRAKNRIKTGAKADQLKYGKGIKEETDKQNVFMGKCWQLPYCRKFVRERCPIFHAKVTCWREQTGCMCEEEVIRNAMENKPVPKDALLAANYIPRNNRLTVAQKRERCKSCVIYNEHQKHKYKLFLPVTISFYVLVYAGLHGPLVAQVENILNSVNRVFNNLTFQRGGATATAPAFFVEAMLAGVILIALTYSLKLLEFLVFKLKV